MNPNISVIVPHFNQHAALARLLRSLDAQAASGICFEVIIADNGSDGPLAKMKLSNVPVTVVHEPSPGPGLARNRGVSVARGEILAFIDSDCTCDPNWVRTIFNHFQKPDASTVIGGDVRISPRAGVLTPIEAYESIFGYRFELYIRRDGYAGTGNLAVRREVFEAVGPFGGIEIAEDQDWGQRATAAGFPATYIPEMIVFTEARENFAELARKWDRHIAHQFADARGLKRRLAWMLRSFAIAASPIGELPRVLTSRRIQGSGARLSAFRVLVHIRLYRAQRMLRLLLSGEPQEIAESWRGK